MDLRCSAVPALFASVLLAAALPLSAQSGTIEHIKVHGASLEGNLLGDSPDRDVYVYLPPSYAATAAKHYPVVYLLHGYGREPGTWVPFVGLPGSADSGINAGTTKEMIVVAPDAFNKYGGSMYSNSPTTGNWEGYIAHDLVNYIDSHYRTIATRASRGLAGHSMGGYGVWRIAMKYPEMWDSIYSLSPCCLMNNPQPRPEGAGPAPAAAPSNGVDVQAGEAAAWSPNPQNPPTYFDRPIVDNKVVPEIAAKWIANSPLAMIDQYWPNLLSYDAIAMDVGLQDTLLRSVEQMAASLKRLGIPHSFETYEGDHSNRLKDRVEQKVLPFFSEHLDSQ